MTERTAIYTGTFDPITYGHIDVIKRAMSLSDKLVVAVAENVGKNPVFSLEKRVELVQKEISDLGLSDNVEVLEFGGLLVEFAKKNGASIIVRGLRAVSDYEYEIQLASMNSKLDPTIQTVFLPASENKQFIASNLVKEVAKLGGDVSCFVSKNVENELKEFYS